MQLWACKKRDFIEPKQIKTQNLVLEKAKFHFSQLQPQQLQEALSNASKSRNLSPLLTSEVYRNFYPAWNWSETKNLANGNVLVLTPLVRKLQVYYPAHLMVARRLRVELNTEGQLVRANIVELISSQKGALEDLEQTLTYLETPISGKLLIYSLGYELLEEFPHNASNNMRVESDGPSPCESTITYKDCQGNTLETITITYPISSDHPDCPPNAVVFMNENGGSCNVGGGPSTGGSPPAGGGYPTWGGNPGTIGGGPWGGGYPGITPIFIGGYDPTNPTEPGFPPNTPPINPKDDWGQDQPLDPVWPINISDPNGVYLQYKMALNEQIRTTQNLINNPPSFLRAEQIANLQIKLAALNEAKSDIAILENSPRTFHFLSSSSANNGEIYYDLVNNRVVIELPATIQNSPALNLGLKAHEVRHAVQFEQGKLSFNKNTGKAGVLYDLQDEVECYKIQYNIDSGVSNGTINLNNNIVNCCFQVNTATVLAYGANQTPPIYQSLSSNQITINSLEGLLLLAAGTNASDIFVIP